MKKKILFPLLASSFFFPIDKSFGQDIHFSQFWMAPLIQNPAMAGAMYDMEGILNYKSQWGSIASPYKTYNASFDMRVTKSKRRLNFLAGNKYFFR